MDMFTKPGAPGIPFVFTPSEVAECFDEGNGFLKQRFRQQKLRALQKMKALQTTLLLGHNLKIADPEEASRYATVTHFSLVKARRTHWGYYLMTLEYVYQGTNWQQVFRFERDSRGGLSGTLYFNSRRRMVAK